MLHIGYEEVKRMTDQRVERSLQRYRTMAALTARMETSPVGSVVELVVPEACDCVEDRIGA